MVTQTMTLKEQALDLQEFFLGTYAEKVLEDAMKSGNEELLRLAVNELGNQRQLIEDHEDDHSY